MHGARRNSRINRSIRLLKTLSNKRYRDVYVQSHTRRFLAQQMRAFRGERSQAEMGALLDKPQSVISRLEDPTYGKWNLSTLFEVAEKLNKAVIVRFVDPKTFTEFALTVDDKAQNSSSFNDASIQKAINELQQKHLENRFSLVFTAPSVGESFPIEFGITPPVNDNSTTFIPNLSSAKADSVYSYSTMTG